MNNYGNMGYYVPNGYMVNEISGLNEYNKFVDNNLALKLSKQAGDNMNFNICDYQQDTNNMYDPYNGFIRGNMFSDLYNEYKISKPYDIKPGNEQAELLTYIDAYCFAAHDLNLYLDNFPNDREMLGLFNDYNNRAKAFMQEYEGKYGPLFVSASTGYPWSWNESPWPWENK